ncbi:hypothetical protein [Thiocapsa sp. UBA6158]|uniref:pirin family protein n=1 Tax=Thiocapsa sp. UBA6158 TaxID=1947692 RepID=UPI0025ECA7A3|nr:hypothetical protein [Thiocapsa sp. UBA6158]
MHFLQIWIIPSRTGVAPRYRRQRFEEADKRGRLRLIISPEGEEGALSVDQDSRVDAGLFDGPEQQVLTLPENRFADVHVARGALSANGQRLTAGDGARLRNVEAISFGEGENAEVLVFDLRPVELSGD